MCCCLRTNTAIFITLSGTFQEVYGQQWGSKIKSMISNIWYPGFRHILLFITSTIWPEFGPTIKFENRFVNIFLSWRALHYFKHLIHLESNIMLSAAGTFYQLCEFPLLNRRLGAEVTCLQICRFLQKAGMLQNTLTFLQSADSALTYLQSLFALLHISITFSQNQICTHW